MEQARPDSTVLPAAQIEAGNISGSSLERDELIARVLTAPDADLSLLPGSAEAKAAYKEACHQHTLRTQFAGNYPALERASWGWWTTEGLSKAMTAGEISPSECARLYPLASERELRMAAVEHELMLGSLFALAFADEFPSRPKAVEVTALGAF